MNPGLLLVSAFIGEWYTGMSCPWSVTREFLLIQIYNIPITNQSTFLMDSLVVVSSGAEVDSKNKEKTIRVIDEEETILSLDEKTTLDDPDEFIIDDVE